MRRIAATLAVVGALLFSSAPAWADSDDDTASANKLFVEVAKLIKAAEQGDSEASFELGWKYQYGFRGIPLGLTEATKWYLKAAEQGHIASQVTVGIMYETGWGVTQNLAEVKKWIRKAARHAHLGTSLGLVGKGPGSPLKTASADTLIFNLLAYSGGAVAI